MWTISSTSDMYSFAGSAVPHCGELQDVLALTTCAATDDGWLKPFDATTREAFNDLKVAQLDDPWYELYAA
jgi:hypothetical protein